MQQMNLENKIVEERLPYLKIELQLNCNTGSGFYAAARYYRAFLYLEIKSKQPSFDSRDITTVNLQKYNLTGYFEKNIFNENSISITQTN